MRIEEALAVVKWGHYYRTEWLEMYGKNGKKLKRPRRCHDERPPYPKGSTMSVDVAHRILVKYIEEKLNQELDGDLNMELKFDKSHHTQTKII